jgi:ABC-type phosphate transport system permease subunit
MSALLLLASTFGLVFALGLQSQFVNNGHYAGAFMNSLLISAGQLGALRIIHAQSFLEYAAYLLGGPLGIVCSIYAYRNYVRRNLDGSTR